MGAKLRLPGVAPSKEEMVDDFAHTIEDWSAHRWFDFGRGLGREMRKSAIAGLPMKYTVGADGLLRKQLSAIEGAGVSHTMMCLPAALFVSVLAAVTVKRLRASA